jgi:hypothetical protein
VDSIAPPKAKPPPELRPQASAEPGPAAKAAERRFAEQEAAQRSELLPDKLLVQLDEKAGRFVHTLTDAETQETKLRYPSEGQLAYSRAIKAYLRAQFGR